MQPTRTIIVKMFTPQEVVVECDGRAERFVTCEKGNPPSTVAAASLAARYVNSLLQ